MSLSGFRMGKRGQVFNATAVSYMAIIIFLVLWAFTSIFAYVLMDYVTQAFTSAGLYTGDVASTGESFLGAIRMLDYLSVFFMLVLITAVGVTSYRVAASPVFYVVQFVMVAFYGFVSYFFNYMFSEMVSPAVFTTAKGYFQNTMIICTNLHWVMLATFVVGSVAMYAKRERGQYLG